MNDRVRKLEEKARRIQEELAEAKLKEARRERVADTKRKVLLGALLQEWMERDDAMKAATMARLDKFLTRNVDRRIFGLTLLPEGPTPAQPPSARRAEAAEG